MRLTSDRKSDLLHRPDTGRGRVHIDGPRIPWGWGRTPEETIEITIKIRRGRPAGPFPGPSPFPPHLHPRVTERCAHDACPKCRGTGRDGQGRLCVHHLYCPCPCCTPRC